MSVCTFCWEFSYDKGSKYIGFERLPIRCKMLLANVGFLESSVEKMIFWWFSFFLLTNGSSGRWKYQPSKSEEGFFSSLCFTRCELMLWGMLMGVNRRHFSESWSL